METLPAESLRPFGTTHSLIITCRSPASSRRSRLPLRRDRAMTAALQTWHRSNYTGGHSEIGLSGDDYCGTITSCNFGHFHRAAFPGTRLGITHPFASGKAGALPSATEPTT
jgi:hypothetical protein